MQEDYLHFIWATHRFDHLNLQTTEGQPIIIMSYGQLNDGAGPDFFNARLKIGDTEWAGNIEMHLRASDWLKHGHQDDAKYHNTILHVVLDDDVQINYPDGSPIPTLALPPYLNEDLTARYLQLMNHKAWVPCEGQFHKVPSHTRNFWLQRLMVERLEVKTARLAKDLKKYQNDWETVCYHNLARSLGLRINADQMQTLAENTPRAILLRVRDQHQLVESILFGQSGLLATHEADEYARQLSKDYQFYSAKYDLLPLPQGYWQFARLRPPSFPTIRIAQLAAIMTKWPHLFQRLIDQPTLKEVKNTLDISASSYWDTHYTFGKPSTQKRSKKLGDTTIRLIIINTIAPLLFLYGRERDQPEYCDKSLDLLSELSPESNSIIKKWANMGWSAQSALESQALIQLKNDYCNQLRCLQCSIGHAVLKPTIE